VKKCIKSKNITKNKGYFLKTSDSMIIIADLRDIICKITVEMPRNDRNNKINIKDILRLFLIFHYLYY
jgi:hypothetical protein